MDAAQGAPALALLGGEVADISGAEADHGTSLLHERGVHQLAHLAGGQHLARGRIHRFHEDLVLHDVQAVLRLAHGRAGAVDVGEPKEVDHLRVPQLLDGLAGALDGAARLAGHDDGVDREVGTRVEALLLDLLAERPGIGRARPDDGGLVLLQHEDEAVARHRAYPDGERAQALGTDDVRAAHVQGEVQAVHVAVGRAHAGLPEQPRLGVLPQIEVLLGKGAHRRHARGAGRGGHEDDVLLGHRAHLTEEAAHVLGLALGFLVDEGELLQILQGLDVLGFHAGFVEGALVVHRVVVGVANHLLKALKLHGLQLRTRHALDLGIVVLLVVGNVLLRHHCSLSGFGSLVAGRRAPPAEWRRAARPTGFRGAL